MKILRILPLFALLAAVAQPLEAQTVRARGLIRAGYVQTGSQDLEFGEMDMAQTGSPDRVISMLDYAGDPVSGQAATLTFIINSSGTEFQFTMPPDLEGQTTSATITPSAWDCGLKVGPVGTFTDPTLIGEFDESGNCGSSLVATFTAASAPWLRTAKVYIGGTIPGSDIDAKPADTYEADIEVQVIVP